MVRQPHGLEGVERDREPRVILDVMLAVVILFHQLVRSVKQSTGGTREHLAVAQILCRHVIEDEQDLTLRLLCDGLG
ncbi:hypothetical protein D3C72_2454040 [compost metagenome]